jgi:hypothetical protein
MHLASEAPRKDSRVDAAGAASLRWRIEQQEHWRQAQAVLDGLQPPVDPDMDDLLSLGEGIRVYSERFTGEGRMHLCKRLVAGLWELGTIAESSDETGSVDVRLAAVVARVA